MHEANLFLKSCFILKDGSLTEAARNLGMEYNRLSRIINRRVKIRAEERRKIAWHLQKPAAKLFGDNES